MKAYETTATIDKTGSLLVQGVPFAPGTDVQVTITANPAASSIVSGAETTALATARERMRELFARIHGFRSATLIRREELYDRDGLH